MEQDYLIENKSLNAKCQCVTFERSGKVLGSCDSLFPVSGMDAGKASRYFPFLLSVAKELEKQEGSDEPIFYPDLDFRFQNYHSICDFTFMKTVDARGAERFIWMIYDNSTHYRLLIKPTAPVKEKRNRVADYVVTSATLRNAG
ncbi:MAG TPA: hypothetical protein VFW78_08130 [Bacteroidia bacterium]|nr:hypothetical protein [Bacteroidia bacterium]